MPIRIEQHGSVLALTLDHPPVNSLSHAMRVELFEALERAAADAGIEAVLLSGAGRAFCAGGDIKEMGTPAAAREPGLSSHIHVAIEACPVPVIALLHGFAVGGGLETALACHYRIGYADTLVGLTEVNLGLVALSGTQRLPRLIGMERAAEMIVSGSKQPLGAFRGTSLVDKMLEGPGSDRLEPGVEFAHRVRMRRPLPLVRQCNIPDADPLAIVERWSERIQSKAPANPAVLAALAALRACAQAGSFDAGLDRARSVYDGLVDSADARAARARFLQRPI